MKEKKHHPYTVGLFGSIPQLDSETTALSIEGLCRPHCLAKGVQACSRMPKVPARKAQVYMKRDASHQMHSIFRRERWKNREGAQCGEHIS